MVNKKVSIVILNYKNWQDTVECLQSVVNITYQPWRVIIVDNDSQNDSLTRVEAWLAGHAHVSLMLTREQAESGPFLDHGFVLIQSEANRGYAAGNNIGIRWAIRAGDPYILILNNDTVVEKEFLEPLVELLEMNTTCALVGPKIVDSDGNIDRNCARRRPEMGDYFFRLSIWGRLFPDNRWHRKHYYIGEYAYNEPRQVDLISGSCMLIRAVVIKQVGLLDEKTFLFLEEPILHEKLRSVNKSTYIAPQSLIIHKGSCSTKKMLSLFIVRKLMESREYYLKVYRNYPLWFILFQRINNKLYCFISLLKHYCFKIKKRGYFH